MTAIDVAVRELIDAEELARLRAERDEARRDRDHYCSERDAHHAIQIERTAERDAAREEVDTLRGECGDDGHAPWCREWRAMVAERDALRAALATLREAVIEHREAMERRHDASEDAAEHMIETINKLIREPTKLERGK